MASIFKIDKNLKVNGLLIFTLAIVALGINSCTHAPFVLPENQRTNDPNICFERDILPIFISNCTQSGCHNAQSNKSGYVLDSYNNIIKKGIVPGNYAASKIWMSVVYNTGVVRLIDDA